MYEQIGARKRLATAFAGHPALRLQIRWPGWIGVVVLVFMLAPLALGPGLAGAGASPSRSIQVDAQTVDGAYHLRVALDAKRRQLSGTIMLDWRNTTGQTQSMLPFRLYPNASFHINGGVAVEQVSVNGVVANVQLRDDTTVMDVTPAEVVAPNARIFVAMTFVTTIPDASRMQVNVLQGSEDAGWWLADWYPILAGWEPGSGWFLDPPTAFGDPTFAESAIYSLNLTSPAGYVVTGSGPIVDRKHLASGEVRTTMQTVAGRDLTLALVPDTPDAPASVTERTIEGTRVRVVLPAAKAIPGLPEAMLDVAADMLPIFSDWLGERPGATLDLAPVSLSGFGGIAWSGSIWLDIDTVVEAGTLLPGDLDTLRFVLAHELAHQWIPIVVGSNNNRHGFLSESLANHLAVLAIREAGDPSAARRYLENQIVAPYLRLLRAANDGVVDAPVTENTSMNRRGALVYGKGTLGFEAIRQEIGDCAYLAALQAYARSFWNGVSTPGDLLQAFEDESGRDLDAVWSFWFDEESTSVRDVQELAGGFL